MNDRPSDRRLACAYIVAIFVPALAAGGWISLDSPPPARASIIFLALLFGSPVALLHLLFLALPAYVVLRKYWPLCWWSAALGGFIVGAIPAGLLALGASDISPDAMRFSFTAGLLGLSGGLAFWAVLTMKKGGPSPDRPSDDQSGRA